MKCENKTGKNLNGNSKLELYIFLKDLNALNIQKMGSLVEQID